MRFKKSKWGKGTANAGVAAADHGEEPRSFLQDAIDEWNHMHAGCACARPIVIVVPKQKHNCQPYLKTKKQARRDAARRHAHVAS